MTQGGRGHLPRPEGHIILARRRPVLLRTTATQFKLFTFPIYRRERGIPQLVLLTKVDEACPLLTEDVRNIYKSGYIKEVMQEVSARLGMTLSSVVPVKNYSEELELDVNCDILLLSSVIQMLRFADNYFDEISDRFSNTETKE